MNILGLNGYAGADHDPSAALLIDHDLVAAVEQERLTRVRHAPGQQPLDAAAQVLKIAHLTANDIDIVAHGWHPRRLGLGVREDAEAERIRNDFHAAGLPLRSDTRIVFVEHHIAHFWSAYPFIPAGVDRTVVDGLVLDGAGESTAGASFRGHSSELTRRWHLHFQASLGLAYEAATRLLGFSHGEEGKTMGLAAYGRPGCVVPAPPDHRFDGVLPDLDDREALRRHARAEVLRYRPLLPAGASFNDRADFAFGTQQMLEQTVLRYLAEIRDPAPVLILSGGVALNCTMNGRIAAWCRERGIALVVPPAANDAGVAIGAAVAVSEQPHLCRTPTDALLGPDQPAASAIDRLRTLDTRVRDSNPHDLAETLAGGAVVGWMTGRAEFGPRALGARSILAGTASTALRDLINVRKGRESWRPLAPSVLADDWSAYFSGTPSPHMLIAAEVQLTRRRALAGVAHVDNSARPQSVPADSSAYARLLEAVGQTSGTPALTCTSFNPAGQPIVHTIDQALHAAELMGLDALAGDGWYLPLTKEKR